MDSELFKKRNCNARLGELFAPLNSGLAFARPVLGDRAKTEAFILAYLGLTIHRKSTEVQKSKLVFS
jgi:hypothetical protein